MDIKKFVILLSGVVLIAFGVGIFSLKYNDDFQPITIKNGSSLFVGANDANVKIGFDGIEIRDDDDYVSIGLNGIFVTDGDDTVDIGWRGMASKDKEAQSVNGDVHLSEELTGIREITISSSFIDVDIVTQNREDLGIDYSGSMRINEIPSLKVDRKGRQLDIRFEEDSASTIVKSSDAVLKLSIPASFDGNITIATASGDIDIDNQGTLGDMNIATASGDILLTLGRDASYNIVGSSASGDYHPTDNMNITQNDNGIFEATIGTGENAMNISTASGNVTFQIP